MARKLFVASGHHEAGPFATRVTAKRELDRQAKARLGRCQATYRRERAKRCVLVPQRAGRGVVGYALRVNGRTIDVIKIFTRG